MKFRLLIYKHAAIETLAEISYTTIIINESRNATYKS